MPRHVPTDGAIVGYLFKRAYTTPALAELTVNAWLIEASVRYAGKTFSVRSEQSLLVMLPCNITRPSSIRDVEQPEP